MLYDARIWRCKTRVGSGAEMWWSEGGRQNAGGENAGVVSGDGEMGVKLLARVASKTRQRLTNWRSEWRDSGFEREIRRRG